MARAEIVGEAYCSNCSSYLQEDTKAWISDQGSMILCLACLEEIHNEFGQCNHELALRYLYEFAMQMGPNHAEAYVCTIVDVIARMGHHWYCKAAGCANKNRYTSGYCGIHDVTLNKGEGVRIGGGGE